MTYTIGVDIGGSKIAAGLVKSNKVLKKTIVPTPKSRNALVKSILYAIENVNIKGVKGIGIGVAGNIDVKGNWVNSPNIPCVRNITLKKIVQKRFKKTVKMNNDANCFALEEAVVGQGKNKRNVFGLILGTGTGGGIVIERKIVEGSDYLAGEVGSIPFKEKHIEEYCSGRFIKRAARKYGLKPDAIYISRLAGKGNKKAMKIYEEFGKHVGYLLALIIIMLNPDIIIIGGGVSNNFPYFRRSMTESMKKHLFFKSTHKTPIKQSKKADYGILGASMLVKYH